MSSLFVRKTVEGWLQDPAVVTPFYPTVNYDQNPSDDIWFTAEFGSTYRETMTFCDGLEMEEGEVQLIYFGPPGTGYDAVLAAMEADLAVLMAQKDPTGKLVLTGRSSPFEYTGGDAEREYAASCFLEYQLYT